MSESTQQQIETGISKWLTPVLLSVCAFLLATMLTLALKWMDRFDRRLEDIEKNQIALMSNEIRLKHLEKQMDDYEQRIRRLEDVNHPAKRPLPASRQVIDAIVPISLVKKKTHGLPEYLEV